MDISKRFNPYRTFNGVLIPEAICRIPDSELSQGAKVTYGRLARYAGEQGYAFPKQDTLGKEIGCSMRQARRYLSELCDFGLLESARRGKKRSNVYFFLWHKIFDQQWKNKSDGTETVHCDGTGLSHPYEESHSKRVKNQNAKRVSDSKAHNTTMDDVIPTDSEGNELAPKKKGGFGAGGAEGKNKIAMRIQGLFIEMCVKQVGIRPIRDVVGYKMVLYAMNTGGLTEKQIIDLFEEWFSLGKSDEDSIQITRAISTNQINNYKVRNNITSK